MKIWLFLLCLWPFGVCARLGFVDQNMTSEVTVKTPQFYAFDSTFQSLISNKDLQLKVRLSTFALFSHHHKRLSGEMVSSQGKFHFEKALSSNLRLENIRGEFLMKGGKVEFSEFKDFHLKALTIHNLRVQNTIFSEFYAKGADFKDVIFNESNFLGVTLPELKAENVKFLGRTAAMNLRGCRLSNVEFNFDRIQHLSFAECRLENVYVNGKLITEPIILKGE
jgi:uncharacterized protein YjbI with pentapeptide repeats